jgi:hypothetical protein
MRPGLREEVQAARAWADAQPLPVAQEVELWVWVERGCGVVGYGATPDEAKRMAVKESINAWLSDDDLDSLMGVVIDTVNSGPPLLMRGSVEVLMNLLLPMKSKQGALELVEYLEGLSGRAVAA